MSVDVSSPTIPPQASSPPAQLSEAGQPEGTSVLLIGGPGSGKSWSLTTLIEAGLELFVLGTEPRFLETLQNAMAVKKLPLDRLHTSHVYPATASWASLIETTDLIRQLNYESLTKIKTMTGKENYGQFVDVYRKLANFKDERTGKEYGPVDKFGPDKALAIDSTTGLAYMSMDLIVGPKPVRHEGEWGVAMDNLERFNNKCTADVKCFFVMTGHIEREPDPLSGGTNLYVSTLGKKLSPKWGRFYSEVVHSYREGPKYYWSTMTPMFDLKQRNLPLADKMEPTFVPLVKSWQSRLDNSKKEATNG